MSNQVYANNMEVSCKQAAGKSICAFPDVCYTPPQTPVTPTGVPIPYPNTGMASDCTDGSSTVTISGQEVMLKDKSSFKKSSGDEAGSAPLKGLMNSTNTGKVFFGRWSMDVKAEGENVVRHLDITTGNHASPLANDSIPWPHIDEMTMEGGGGKCAGMISQEKTACADYKPNKEDGLDVCKEAKIKSKFSRGKGVAAKRAESASKNDCSAARRCRLLPYKAKPRDGINGCCPAQTGDHLVPKSSFFKKSVAFGKRVTGWSKYKIADAPCMCLEGGSCSGSHGLRHAHHKAFSKVKPGAPNSFEKEMAFCAKGAKAVAPQCDEECIKQQLREGHKGMGDTDKPIKHSPTGRNYSDDKPGLLAKIKAMLPTAGVGAPG